MARNYKDTRRRKRAGRRIRGYAQLFGCIVGILLVAGVITRIIDGSSKPPVTQTPASEGTGMASELLAPLPMQDTGEGGLVRASFGPVQQDAATAALISWDKDTIRQAKRGQVDLDYFADAAFLGDSLTEGFTDYGTNLGGALVCGYRGIGPDSVVKRSTQKHAERGEEIPLNVLAANKPKKLYVLLGSNSLTIQGNDEQFIAYYSQMLDELRKVIAPGGIIYVQSIPPVRADVTASKPGLDNTRIANMNARLAALAAEKGCYYIDLWETLADEAGTLKEAAAANDGIHFTAGNNGYGAWVQYLRSHTVYSAASPWTPGSAYHLEA